MANEKNEKKEVAKKKAKGPGFFARIGKFFREVFGEVKKLSWPTKRNLLPIPSRSLRSSC